MEGRLAAVEKQLKQLLARQHSKNPTEAQGNTQSKAISEEDGQAGAATALHASASTQANSQASKQSKHSNGEQRAGGPSVSGRKGADKAMQP